MWEVLANSVRGTRGYHPRGPVSTPGSDVSRARLTAEPGSKPRLHPKGLPLPPDSSQSQDSPGTRMASCQVSEVSRSQGLRRRVWALSRALSPDDPDPRPGPAPPPTSALGYQLPAHGAEAHQPQWEATWVGQCLCVTAALSHRKGHGTPALGLGQPWAPPRDTDIALGSHQGWARPAGVLMNSLDAIPSHPGLHWESGSSHCHRFVNSTEQSNQQPWAGDGAGQAEAQPGPLNTPAAAEHQGKAGFLPGQQRGLGAERSRSSPGNMKPQTERTWRDMWPREKREAVRLPPPAPAPQCPHSTSQLQATGSTHLSL